MVSFSNIFLFDGCTSSNFLEFFAQIMWGAQQPNIDHITLMCKTNKGFFIYAFALVAWVGKQAHYKPWQINVYFLFLLRWSWSFSDSCHTYKFCNNNKINGVYGIFSVFWTLWGIECFLWNIAMVVLTWFCHCTQYVICIEASENNKMQNMHWVLSFSYGHKQHYKSMIR